MAPLFGNENPYRSKPFFIQNSRGTRVAVKKRAYKKHGPIYNETAHELKIYNKLREAPHFRDYILPLREGRVNQMKVTLEFNYVDGGDLISFVSEFINKLGDVNITPSKASIFFKLFADVARALKFLYQNGVAHGDIKPDNIYVAGHKALLFDFGQSVQKENHRFDAISDADMLRYITKVCGEILVKSFGLNERYMINLISTLEALPDRLDQYEAAAEYWDGLYDEYKPHATSRSMRNTRRLRRLSGVYRSPSRNHVAINMAGI